MQWQEKYYSANLMKLVVLGKGVSPRSHLPTNNNKSLVLICYLELDSLDELTKEVVAKFSPALNRHLSVPIFAGSPLGKEQLQV